MKYVLQFGRIFAFCLAGELLHYMLPLPVPASIYGLALLLGALLSGLVKLEQVKEAGHFLTGIFALLFVPGAVGVIERLGEMKALLLPFLAALLPETILIFGAAGLAVEFVLKKRGKNPKREEA